MATGNTEGIKMLFGIVVFLGTMALLAIVGVFLGAMVKLVVISAPRRHGEPERSHPLALWVASGAVAMAGSILFHIFLLQPLASGTNIPTDLWTMILPVEFACCAIFGAFLWDWFS